MTKMEIARVYAMALTENNSYNGGNSNEASVSVDNFFGRSSSTYSIDSYDDED
jgi:hypothetical protein